MAKKISKVLLKAADLIDAGWIKGQNFKKKKDGTYSYCLLGAVTAAETGDTGAWGFLRDFMGCASPIQYNDAKETKKEEVLDLLLNAAEFAKLEGK